MVVRSLVAIFLATLWLSAAWAAAPQSQDLGQSPTVSSFGSAGTPCTPPLVSCHRGLEELTQSSRRKRGESGPRGHVERNGELWLLWSLLRGKPLPVGHCSVLELQEEGGAATLVALRILLGTGQGGECGLWCLHPELPGGKRSEAGWYSCCRATQITCSLVSAQP